MSLGLVWKMSDALNGMMAIPNLIALLLLSPVVFKLTREYYQQSTDETLTDKS
jgi:AGCS family alanine or glycine:cation symporter